jgi:hypothetical protein
MRWLKRYRAWRLARRLAWHRRWLRKNKVLIPPPDPRCARGKVEAPGKVFP